MLIENNEQILMCANFDLRSHLLICIYAKFAYMPKFAYMQIERTYIATLHCDVPTEKVIFKGEQMNVRI